MLGEARYIDFREYCKLMAIFNPRYNLDEKIKFYFRIFDVNNDKRVEEDDLSKMIDILFGNKFEGKDKETLIERIIKESDTGQKGYLDKEDIQKVLWATNIEQKCSIAFFQ